MKGEKEGIQLITVRLKKVKESLEPQQELKREIESEQQFFENRDESLYRSVTDEKETK